MIPVTKSYIPNIEKYKDQVERAFRNGWLTNRGELILELEQKLRSFLGVKNILLMTNGTIPIQVAIKLLGLGGEVITTPFSYVATTSSIVWENCTPVFVDIDPEYLTINEDLIEEKITNNTTCILATHVFGNACNIETIQRIADKHSLKVIYDAAHCFGVKYKGRSIFEYGNISTASFHATKLFHTGEGGAIFCTDQEEFKRIYYSHNFGHNGPLEYHGLGINGKITELQAAMGLCVFDDIALILNKRKEQSEKYSNKLMFSDEMRTIKLREGVEWNYSYFPVILKSEEKLDKLLRLLAENDIHPRRYFYPSLNKLPYLADNCDRVLVSESIASRVICLPLYHTLKSSEQDLVIDIINSVVAQ
jgi:dTDP-4-amino-4,6-dideoxygalactose transaminase